MCRLDSKWLVQVLYLEFPVGYLGDDVRDFAVFLLQMDNIRKKLLGPMKALTAMKKAAESGGK